VNWLILAIMAVLGGLAVLVLLMLFALLISAAAGERQQELFDLAQARYEADLKAGYYPGSLADPRD
jgi:hypothetical protein